jgi:GNAT superfamily N-acetyltransferase
MHVRLPDDTELLVRPIAPGDKALLGAALGRLSPASARARFLAAKPRLSASELAYLTEVDGEDHFALVAVLRGRPDEAVAVARYVRLREDPEAAEMAIVVDDRYQSLGLGQRLTAELAARARAHGVRRFEGLMLADNRAAHRLFASLSERTRTLRDQPGVDRVVAELFA